MRFDHGWDMPREWRGVQLPRRGGQPFPVPLADLGAPPRLAELLAASDLDAARLSDYHPVLLDEARSFAAGSEVSPRGAAAAALVVAEPVAERRVPVETIADAWLAGHGVVFAVRAVTEMAGMLYHPLRSGDALCRRPLRPAVTEGWHGHWKIEDLRQRWEDGTLWDTARVIRAHLAATDDATFTRAAAALRDYRGGVLPQRLVASFVLPDQDDWIEEDIEALPGWFKGFTRYSADVIPILPVFSATSAAQIQRHADAIAAIDAAEGRYDFDRSLVLVNRPGGDELIATLLDGLGTEAVPLLTENDVYRRQSRLQWMWHREMPFEALQRILNIPGDEAPRYVIRSTLGHRQGDFERLGLLARDPARTVRLLAEPDAPPMAAEVLGMYLLADPALGDLLPEAGRDRFRTGVGTHMSAALRRDEGDRKQLIAWLSSIDTDEAFGQLAAAAGGVLIRPAIVKLAARRPARALRVLAGLTPENTAAAELLRDHVLSRPELVAKTLPELPAEARARVEAIVAAHVPPGPVAPESALPEALRAAGKTKAIPSWLVVPTLPAVRLRGHDGAVLPEPAVRRLLGMLASATFAAPHPGLAEVRDACERADLTAFGWELFAQWARVEHPSGDKHALYALGFLGDDAAVPRLTETVLGWTDDAIARAKIGLDVLVALGTDTALVHLQRMARTAKAKGFRKLAAAKLDQIAQARGLSTAELGDRIAADLGLDADGRITLDYGPRRFTVSFDVKLNPLIADAEGRRRKSLPPVAAADDATLAEEARAAFAVLKKEARALATERLRALEEAMVTGRSWTPSQVRAFFTDHPAVRYPARALLWQVAGGPAFRVAEDGSFADVDDKTLVLDDERRVTLFHPAPAGPELALWAETFADYEIFQPFPQLGREVHRLAPEQAAASRLPLDTGRDGDLDMLHPLAARGWRFNADGGVERDWPGGFTTQITPSDVSVTAPAGATFGDLGVVAASETLRDAQRLTSRG
ncbi:hypothetical protein J2S43_001797 [Catenuloplanes nepalensis]|uniref:DUF4132 domain-containing protein n=1 Tax=Catenuloplanes nepalensis TaxID=587533 RepID=A0ABT9MPD4_9ACTN|nr:DUF4132 domain-containing protein [Catenuloplanes nepalensis]MDP9793285.1 hypothetical protein [Catenuloplanes nepalensis]